MLPPDKELTRFPAPHEYVTGITAHNPHWGPGWLGYTKTQYDEGEVVAIWYLCASTGKLEQVHYDVILTFDDTWTGYTWLIFALEEEDALFPFVLSPRPGFYPRAVHPRLRSLLCE